MSPMTSARLTNKRCMCPTCKEVFSTLSNFDRHRVGTHGERVCVAPSSTGMEIKHGSNGTWWGMPGRTET
jgi:hypothetical protein